MAEMLPKTAWVIRTKSGRPIIFDPDMQLDENGNMTNEFTFHEKWRALKVLLLYSEEERKAGSKEEFVLVEKEISPEEIYWVMTAEDVHRKAMEEKAKCGKN